MNDIQQRNYSMDVLRIVACLGVVLHHVTSSMYAMGYVDSGSKEWMFNTALYNFTKWSVPIFVMITGFFFLNPAKELPLKKLYGKYILRLVLSLVFWTWFYAIILQCIYVCYYPFGGQDNNFWYIGMCIGLYISMPVLRIVAANDKLLSYSCWIWLFIRFYMYIGKYVEVPIVFTDYVYTGYVGYCLWGYYLSRLKLNQKQERAVFIVGLVSLVVTVVLPVVSDGNVGFSFESPGPILISIAMFYFVIKHPVRISIKATKIISHLSAMTFGIYMVHTFVAIETFTRIHRFIPNVYLLSLTSFIVTFVLSYVIILIIKQIPILKKWVV
jgi:surface polysaccharide O-acyltransferase-like enzyme